MLRGFSWSSEQSGFALVFESETLTVDVDDDRMMQDPIKHRHGQYAVTGEGRIPTAEGEIR
jgi:hypothetical protein